MKLLANKKRTPEKESERIAAVISMMVLFVFVTNFSFAVQSLTGIPSSLISAVCKGALLLGLISCAGIMLRSLNACSVLYVLVIAAVFTINWLSPERSDQFAGTVVSHITTVAPMVLLVRVIDDYGAVIKSLTRVSYIIVSLSFLLLFFRTNGIQDYSMGLANSITLPCVMMVYSFYKSRKIIDIIMAGVGSFVIVIVGSRGALLGIAVFGLLVLLRGFRTKKDRLKVIVIILLAGVALLFIEEILSIMSMLIASRGWSSRTLFLLLNDVGHQSGREQIYGGMISAIRSNPLKMHGIAGEYALTGGLYAHNFFLELLVDFGIIIGGLLSLVVAYRIVITLSRGIRRETDIDMFRMILFSVSVPVCLFSGTLWTSSFLWMWFFVPDSVRKRDAEAEFIREVETELLS